MLYYLRLLLSAPLYTTHFPCATVFGSGLLIAGIAALIVVVVFAFGKVIKNIFQSTCNSVGQSGGGTC